MRTVAADWMGNPSYAESNHASSKPSKEENGKPSISFCSRAAAPTAAQVQIHICIYTVPHCHLFSSISIIAFLCGPMEVIFMIL
jgi:hypothetical protein